MGNRAIVKPSKLNYGVYLHWNGGVDSVEAFLEYCKLKGYRSFNDNYGVARFIQVVSNWFGGGLSVGIETDLFNTERCAESHCLDNGMYIVDGWEIVQRLDAPSGREGYDRTEMLISIDKAQPESEQLGEDFFKAELVNTSDLEIGDKVYMFNNLENKFNLHTVVGFGEDTCCNGTNVLGMPYVDLYLNDGTYSININNYIREKEIRKIK